MSDASILHSVAVDSAATVVDAAIALPLATSETGDFASLSCDWYAANFGLSIQNPVSLTRVKWRILGSCIRRDSSLSFGFGPVSFFIGFVLRPAPEVSWVASFAVATSCWLFLASGALSRLVVFTTWHTTKGFLVVFCGVSILLTPSTLD